VVPHHPCCEQQVPKVLPVHVCPDVPPQVPSGLTVSFVAVEAGAVLLLVDELVDFEVEVEDFFDDVDVEDFDELDERDELVPVHVPEAGLQPAPQYAEVLPQ